MNPQLQSLFDSLRSEQDLRRLFFTPRRPEDLTIEYKRKRDPRDITLHDDDKRNFSRTVSAFSNATGGIVLWGINVGRQKGGREYARSIHRIFNAERIAETMRDLLLNTVQPANTAVQVEAIVNRQGNGFIKILIPPGTNPPHRAMAAQREYWVRMDGRTEELEDFQIRDILTRRSRPNLIPTILAKFRDNGTGGQFLDVTVAIQNTGQALAKHVGWITFIENADVHSVDQCIDETARNTSPVVAYDLPANNVIHPNLMRVHTGKIVLQTRAGHEPVRIQFRWYGEDFPVENWLVTITPQINDIEVEYRIPQ